MSSQLNRLEGQQPPRRHTATAPRRPSGDTVGPGHSFLPTTHHTLPPSFQPKYGDGTPNQGNPQDHADLLGVYGLPPDLAARIDQFFRDNPADPQAAAQAAITWLRGTDWYRQTFPGITEARAIGFIGTDLGSEREYRRYYLAYQQQYKQYYGRDMTWDEAYRLFSQGVQPDFLGRQFQGAAFIGANQGDIQYLAGAFTEQGRLKEGDLTAYGQEQAGIDSPLGQLITSRLQFAGQKVQRIFQGTTATPSLSMGGAGLKSDSLLGTKTIPDLPA